MKYFLFAAALPLTACNQGMGDAENADQKQECPVVDSRDWSAKIDAKQDPDAPRLLVRGVIDLPTPDWRAQLRETHSDRAMPPGVHFAIDFTPPEGPVAQVVTSRHLTHVSHAADHGYRSITIHCGDQALAELTDIPTME
ncbi:MAG: hypothetical protein HKN14_07615 [Marinicaulis sp.]|nr:hypothetical protein [Marinicaulis sp.]